MQSHMFTPHTCSHHTLSHFLLSKTTHGLIVWIDKCEYPIYVCVFSLCSFYLVVELESEKQFF